MRRDSIARFDAHKNVERGPSEDAGDAVPVTDGLSTFRSILSLWGKPLRAQLFPKQTRAFARSRLCESMLLLLLLPIRSDVRTKTNKMTVTEGGSSSENPKEPRRSPEFKNGERKNIGR